MLKTIFNSALAQGAAGRVLGLYMVLVGFSTRWTWINRAAAEKLWAAGGPVVLCFWHGRIVLSHMGWGLGRLVNARSQPVKVLISNSREGGIVAAAARVAGAGVIRGSSGKPAKAGRDVAKRKGGVEAMREMLRHMGKGGAVALAPDGPRGPRMRAQLGPIQLAKHRGAPIICFAWSASRRKVFASWDRFVLPLPFGRGYYLWGDPIRIDPHADDAAIEAARARVENELMRLTAEADRLAGHAPIEAAPPSAAAFAPAPAAAS
ncbi:MAG: lysophospholipid acyltransferase family protein [Hyphomonadaceae bacterium]